MTRLIHLNGPPGVGKSTLARRYADDHPGTLLCDIDVVRTMIAGWRDDEGAAGRARTASLALITGYLGTGHDVVVPQLCARADQLARFVAAAHDAGAEHVHVLLTLEHEALVRRFRERAETADDAWTAYATASWDAQGGDEALGAWTTRLASLPARRVASTDPESTYAALLAALGEPG